MRNHTGPIVSLVQARMSSSRLPGKVLLPLGSGTVLDQVVQRVRAFSEQVIVCTSIDRSDDPIEEHCQIRGVLCHRGSLDNVFSRFRSALRSPEVKPSPWFARVTADCPLVSSHLAVRLMENMRSGDDYACYRPETLPRGLSVELVRRATFEAIDPTELDELEKEHVTLHLYEHPNRYTCRWVDPPGSVRHPELRLTLDYAADYTLLKELFDKDANPSPERAIERMLADPSLCAINSSCRQRSPR